MNPDPREHERLLLERARGGKQPGEGGIVLLALVIGIVILIGILAKYA